MFIIYSITYRFCVQKTFKSACGLPPSRDVFVERKTRRFAKSNLFPCVIVIAFIRRCENKPFERAYPWREHVTKAKLCSRRVSFWSSGKGICFVIHSELHGKLGAQMTFSVSDGKAYFSFRKSNRPSKALGTAWICIF